MSPVDNADLYTQYPQLVWKYMNNVEEYTIELAKDDEFSDIVWSATHNISLSVGTDDHFHTITGFPFENDIPYYWRVKASNDHGESNWSTAHSFTVRALSAPGIPEQVAPADGSTVSSTTPTFSWTAVNDAATYRLVVFSDVDDASFWDCYTTTTSCSVLTPRGGAGALEVGGTYYIGM